MKLGGGKVEFQAYDLGQPSLSSTATVTISVDYVTTSFPQDWQMNFSDMIYSVSISEDALVNTLVKNISLVNKPAQVLPVSCEIVNGNENGNPSAVTNLLLNSVVSILFRYKIFVCQLKSTEWFWLIKIILNNRILWNFKYDCIRFSPY